MLSKVGLFVFPSIIPRRAQLHLLDRLLHRDMANPCHKTNLHPHYEIDYPSNQLREHTSFFDIAAQDIVLRPKDPTVHKPLNMATVLNKKLRWTTLGGQYDWTRKLYPEGKPPPFPNDVARLIEGLFPVMKAQAAILNLYSPGDTLSLHRDVSEECDKPLASISLGCDALFVVGLSHGEDECAEGDSNRVASVTVRLRSGDVAVMSGQARFAWHGVPQVIAGTCPAWMQDWPCIGGLDEKSEDKHLKYARWKGWMAGKRINLNVRQMRDNQ